MDVMIIRKQEPTQGLLGGKNVRLGVDISISLSEKEQELIKKYHDPLISENDLTQFGGPEILSSIKLEARKTSSGTTPALPCYLSKFKLAAHVDNGFNALGNMQKFVKAVINVTKDKMEYLATLEGWEGKEVITTS